MEIKHRELKHEYMLINEKSIEEPDITIECEFGDEIIEGRLLTLGHHVVEYMNKPSCCKQLFELLEKNNWRLPENIKQDKYTIGINNPDLDTVLTIFLLENLDWVKNVMEDITGRIYLRDFVTFADNMDNNGVHTIRYCASYDISAGMVVAYINWLLNQDSSIDYKEQIKNGLNFIYKMFNDNEVVRQYLLHEKNRIDEIMKNHISDNRYGRLFKSAVFCNAEYLGFDFIVNFNPIYKSVTLSFKDSGKRFNAKKIMQDIFGEKAGGHLGIAGTPKNEKFDVKDAFLVFVYVTSLYCC